MGTAVVQLPEKQFDQAAIIAKPQFIDKSLLTEEQLTDPDYRLKSLQDQYGGKFDISCSKCHHCR